MSKEPNNPNLLTDEKVPHEEWDEATRAAYYERLFLYDWNRLENAETPRWTRCRVLRRPSRPRPKA
ncbi:MAG TPA: hypothetical protein VF666_04380 [Pyrinomonadaceae bacterium]|jgi:hypothetical protein